MTAKVIQGFFVVGRPRLPSPVVQPKAMPGLPVPPAPAFAGRPPVAQPRLPGPPAPAIAGRPPGPPVPAFAGLPPVMQRHGAGDAFSVDPGQLGLASSGGRPLPDSVRGKMEAALRADFSNVRVHVGPQAERIGAIAFTIGSDIYFAPGRFQPDTAHGQQLLGHELAHVVQQRAGRVKNPLGSGLAVVQDHALEAEADRLGRQAGAHRLAAQAKMPSGAAAQPSAQVRISPPISAGPGSYRLAAGAGGRPVGSVTVHARDKIAVEITDLNVSEAQRGQGIGRMLLASAARTGQQFGKSKVTLAAQDNGSGHLTHWYKGMGFAQIGVNQRGYPQLEAPISRVLAGTAQRQRNPSQQKSAQPKIASAVQARMSPKTPGVVHPQPARGSAYNGEVLQPAALAVPVLLTGAALYGLSWWRSSRTSSPPATPERLLANLAVPRTFKAPDVQVQQEIVDELEQEITRQKSVPRDRWDKNREVFMHSPGEPYIAFCLGGVVFPDNLDLPIDALIKNATLERVTPARGLPDGYSGIKDKASLKNKIITNVIKTIIAAGQLEYLKRCGFNRAEWKIVAEVHYMGSRGKIYEGQLHKDTLGQTLFVNLNYLNKDAIPGPEYILHPRPVPEHEAQIRGQGQTPGTLPPEFTRHLEAVRVGQALPGWIERSEIPAYGVVAFVDELIHHATPVFGGRTVTADKLREFLEKKFPARYNTAETEYAVMSQSYWPIRSYPADKQKWYYWIEMVKSGKKELKRAELRNNWMSDDLIDELLEEYSGTFREVGVPNSRATTVRAADDPRLKRRMSVERPNLARPTGERRFFRMWVRAVPANAPL